MIRGQKFEGRELVGASIVMFLVGFGVAVVLSHVPVSVWTARWWEQVSALGAAGAVMAVVWAHLSERARIIDRERRDAAPLAAMINQELFFVRGEVAALHHVVFLLRRSGGPILNVARVRKFSGAIVSKTLKRSATVLGCFDSRVGELLGLTLAESYRLEEMIKRVEPDVGGILNWGAENALRRVEEQCQWMTGRIDQLLHEISRYLPPSSTD